MLHRTRSFSLVLMVLCVQQLVSSYREDGLQFLSVDLPVAVLIKQFEIPLEFLVDFSLQHQADGSNVLHKVDVSILQIGAEPSRGCWVGLFHYLVHIFQYFDKLAQI